MRCAAGFTLLEAVLAVVILSGAVIATLGIRSRSMIASERMQAVQRDERDAQAVFDLLIAGMLGAPDRVDRETGVAEWSGTLSASSSRAYTVRRSPEFAPDPLRVDTDTESELKLWRYDIAIGETEASFLWHR